MRLVQTSKVYRLTASIGLGLALAVLLLLNVSRAGAQPPAPRNVVFLIDNSPSVSIGDTNGDRRPDTAPTDEQDIRLRLVRFVVRVLSLDPSNNQCVGAISFVRSTQELMPLAPVRDWSKADFAEIREVDHPSDTQTDFAAALGAAANMLSAPDHPECLTASRPGDIVVVTDGLFSYRRDRQTVRNVLQNLPREMEVYVLTFGALDQQTWQGFLTDSLISTYRPNVNLTSPDQVYGTVLRDLGAEMLLADLIPVEVDGEGTIPLTVLPFRTWTRYQILPDSPMTVTFLQAGQVVTPVVAGNEYVLFQPQVGKWTVRLQGSGLVYFRQAGEGVANIALYLRAPEDVLALGKDVAVRAGLTAGGAPVTDMTHFVVTATVNGAEEATGPLRLKPDEAAGLFTTTVPSDWFKSGMYTITLTAESDIPGIEVRPAVHQFQVVAPSKPMVTTTPPGMTQTGSTIRVKASIITLVSLILAILLLILAILIHNMLRIKGIARSIVEDPSNRDPWSKLDTLSIGQIWPVVAGAGERLATDWRVNHRADRRGPGNSALADTLFMSTWKELKSCLDRGDSKTCAILIYAGLVVSTTRHVGQTDPVSVLEVLEGVGLETSNDTRRPYRFIGEYLDDNTSHEDTFLRVLDFYRRKPRRSHYPKLGEQYSIERWKEYDEVIKYVLGGKSDVNKVDKIVRRLLQELSISDDDEKQLKEHPILQIALSHLTQK